MAKNVVFDEDSAARIAAAVKWVEQYSLDETPEQEEPLPPDADTPEAAPPDASDFIFLSGTFDGAWSKGAYKNVSTSSLGTLNALNIFADVNDAGESDVSCAVAREGSVWYLIAAEC